VPTLQTFPADTLDQLDGLADGKHVRGGATRLAGFFTLTFGDGGGRNNLLVHDYAHY
jgi:hypothetical protein